MSPDAPAYLASLQSNVRQRPIPWDGAVRSGHLTDDQLAKIRAVDKARQEARVKTVEADLDGYRLLFVGGPDTASVLASAAKRQDVIQYILVLLSDLLDAVPSLSTALFKSGDPYRHFLPLLAPTANPEDPIPLLTSTVLVSLMASSKDESPATVDKALPVIFSYLSSLVKNSDPGLQDIGVQEFSSLLYGHVNRNQFWKQRSETVAPLVSILQRATGAGNGDSLDRLINGSNGGSILNGSTTLGPSIQKFSNEGSVGGVGYQLLYHVLLVMWQLSFEAKHVGQELNEEYDVVLLYTKLLRLPGTVKTVRLLVMTLRELLFKNETALTDDNKTFLLSNENTLLPTAVLVRLPDLLPKIREKLQKSTADNDLVESLDDLEALFTRYTEAKTTFDEYVDEVYSGHLRWSPPHCNTVFWAENARRILEHENGDLVRRLADVMQKPWDDDKAVLAIACNDVGWLVREVPEKRSQLERLGIKARVMELMTEADENVRWESLRALGGWLKYSFDTK